MRDLISVSSAKIGEKTVNAVNARDLHEFLQVGKDFSTWIKGRIEAYEFTEGSDFVCSPVLGSEGRGGHNRFDYFITLNMARELAMVERNERGKQARQYFIECERRANARVPAGLPDFTNPIIAARAWADEKERGDLNELALREVQQKVIEAQPKLKALDTIATCQHGSMCITNSAKTLQVQPKALFLWLSTQGDQVRKQAVEPVRQCSGRHHHVPREAGGETAECGGKGERSHAPDRSERKPESGHFPDGRSGSMPMSTGTPDERRIRRGSCEH